MSDTTLTVSTPRIHGLALLELAKPRLSSLVLFTTLAGFLATGQGIISIGLLLHTLVGTALVATGANALNQILERDADRLMMRTRHRPLPSERLTVVDALRFAVVASLLGLSELLVFVNLLTAGLAALALGLYVLVYTPLKRITVTNTLVGAVVGAIPPMMGWSAATGRLDTGAFLLFAILFVWQLPHFFAIAWIYRDDYIRGGFRMISVADPDGRVTARQVAILSTLLLPVSLLPAAMGAASAKYAAGALILGVAFMACSIWLQPMRQLAAARRCFLASIIYLPCLLILLLIDRM